VLEEKKVTPLGSEKPVPCDTRIMAATNKNLMEMMKAGKFREDLYYRLCGMEIRILPLRERAEDIFLLALHFLNKTHSQQKGKLSRERPLSLSSEALDLLMAYTWPGNVRQLEQALFAAATLCEGDEITPANLPLWLHKPVTSGLKEGAPTPAGSLLPEREPSPEKDRRFLGNEERIRYLEALHATQYPGTGRWNVSAAARQLGIPRETLSYHLKKLRLFR
jgi:DNA-binding NtrC family response regulator